MSSTDPLVASIIGTNSAAIRLLQEGRNLMAIATLHQALGQLHELCNNSSTTTVGLRSPPSSSTGATPTTTDEVSGFVVASAGAEQCLEPNTETRMAAPPDAATFLLEGAASQPQSVVASREIPSKGIAAVPLEPTTHRREDRHTLTFFDRAFQIRDDDSTTTYECLTCCLIYNLALAFHRESYETNQQSVLLSRAQHLYQQGLAIVDQGVVAGGTLWTGTRLPAGLVLLSMALYFNLSQVHAESFQTEKCRIYRARLALVLRRWEGTRTLVPDWDMAFFCTNLFLVERENFRLAAAA